jgi:hypothetical protein
MENSTTPLCDSDWERQQHLTLLDIAASSSKDQPHTPTDTTHTLENSYTNPQCDSDWERRNHAFLLAVTASDYDGDDAGGGAGGATATTPEPSRSLPKPSKRRHENPAAAAPATASASSSSSPCPPCDGEGADRQRPLRSATAMSRRAADGNGDGEAFAGAKQVDQTATTTRTTTMSTTAEETKAAPPPPPTTSSEATQDDACWDEILGSCSRTTKRSTARNAIDDAGSVEQFQHQQQTGSGGGGGDTTSATTTPAGMNEAEDEDDDDEEEITLFVDQIDSAHRACARALAKPCKRRHQVAAAAAASASADGAKMKRSRRSAATTPSTDGDGGANKVDQLATTAPTMMSMTAVAMAAAAAAAKTPEDMSAEILNHLRHLCEVFGARERKTAAALRVATSRVAAAVDAPGELARLLHATGQRSATSQDCSKHTRIVAAVRFAQTGLGLDRERMLRMAIRADTKAPTASSAPSSSSSCAGSRPRWVHGDLPREFGVLLKELGLTARNDRCKAVKALRTANGFEYAGTTCSWEDGDEPKYFEALKHGYHFGSFGDDGVVAIVDGAPAADAS